jgi:hypothetical protein
MSNLNFQDNSQARLNSLKTASVNIEPLNEDEDIELTDDLMLEVAGGNGRPPIPGPPNPPGGG